MALARKMLLLALPLGLAGCVAARAPVPLAASGPTAVEMAGQSYIADYEPSEQGAMLSMSRDPVGFGYADGAEAKRVATNFCANRKSVLAPVLAEFKAGAWIFKGGCV